ncbi:hypothetical protein SUGI_0145240 [Cryptomeria japonica]|nr:hypothetical protein SUGI_0145240 [Cryptomeria japonica]
MGSKVKGAMASLARENSFKTIFSSSRKSEDDDENQGSSSASQSPGKKWISELSSLANVVVGRCARILLLSTEDLQQQFETEASDFIKHPSRYARNFLEYCCFKALAVATQLTDHVSDKGFRRLTFDMMLAWEAPAMTSKPLLKVDIENYVGPEAFERLAPAIPTVADVITAHNLFDVLTSSTRGRLPFPIYDKYLAGVEKAIKTMKNQSASTMLSSLRLANGEMIIDVDGTVTTQPVLQHVGVSAWPGRLTLTDHALYFEALGIVSYDKAKKYDLSSDLKQVVKPDLTGPWGARLFDKAVMYKSISLPEPVVMEFPELTGHSRRDYWLAILQEILCVHQFIRKFHLEGVGRAEAISKSVLGILRLRAIREAFHILPPHPERLLTFNLAEKLPGGDLILEALSDLLPSVDARSPRNNEVHISKNMDKSGLHSTSALSTLSSLGFTFSKVSGATDETGLPVGEVLVGELTPLERAVMQSRSSFEKVELAQATIQGVKVEGIDTNAAVMKELLLPAIEFVKWLQVLATWEDPLKSVIFCTIVCYIIYRGWICYALPCFFLAIAIFMLCSHHFSKGKPITEIRVAAPPTQNTVEQLLALQQAVSQVEELVQDGNIILLKIRALLLAAFPQATDRAAVVLIFLAIILAFLPSKIIILLVFLEIFTRQMPLRQPSTERVTRRFREWWFSIPAAPVLLDKPKQEKKKK